jgi:hypothetical protein
MGDDFLQSMQDAQQADRAKHPAVVAATPQATDWFAFRRRHPDLYIARTGEDGSLEDWQALLRAEGPDRLTTAIMAVRKTLQKGSKVRLGSALEALEGDSRQDLPQSEDTGATRRSKIDLLVWCLVHSPNCYADARCQWQDSEGVTERTVGGLTFTLRSQVCVQGQATWEKLRDRAAEAQAFIFAELGKDITPLTKPGVYHTVTSDPRWLAYLRGQRLIP